MHIKFQHFVNLQITLYLHLNKLLLQQTKQQVKQTVNINRQ